MNHDLHFFDLQHSSDKRELNTSSKIHSINISTLVFTKFIEYSFTNQVLDRNRTCNLKTIMIKITTFTNVN